MIGEFDDQFSKLHLQDDTDHEEALFDPPLYKQRYHAVAKLINQHGAKTVIDVGCSEGQFLTYVKDSCPNVEEINGVDIDYELLDRRKLFIKPAVSEYVIKRPNPLKMALYHGSISSPDIRFRNVDFISCIEVIEHLNDDILEQVPESIFGILKPKVVAVTTPNSEYNVLFKNFSGKRHWDHKFEWNREAFNEWCKMIEIRYNYRIELTGVGLPPVHRSEVGHCSQMAVFIKNENQLDEKECESLVTDSDTRTLDSDMYQLIKETIYPFENLNENTSEKLLNEIYYIISHFYYIDEQENTSENGFCDSTYGESTQSYSESGMNTENHNVITQEIKISELLNYPGIKKLKLNQTEMKNVLKEKYELTKNDEYLISKFDLGDFSDRWSDDDVENEDHIALNEVDNDFMYDEEEVW